MKKHGKHYFKSDGNGGYNISKSITWATIITILILLGNAVWATANLNSDIKYIKEEINNVKSKHPIQLEKLNLKDTQLELSITSIQAKLDNIAEMQKEIKEALKEHDSYERN